jgi:isopenicillin N synthase-like dioxygenase
MHNIPVIDLAADLANSKETTALSTLDLACRDHGFFLVTGHGMNDVIEDMWAAATQFFAAPRAARLALMRTAEKPLGYYDRELTKQKRDLKEVFDFSRPTTDRKHFNQWPEDMPEFRNTMTAYYEAMSDLAEQLLALLHTTLGIAQNNPLHGDRNTSNVRLNNYPVGDPLDQEEQAANNALGDMALHHHTDPGLITLLVQDATGGLQTLSTADGWIDVPPLKHSIIVNLGDALQAWSNDIYKAAVHRVVPMTDKARMSTPYFFNPAADAVLEPHPTLAKGKPHYRPFAWREFIQSRVDDNFADLGQDDVQVARYRLPMTEAP